MRLGVLLVVLLLASGCLNIKTTTTPRFRNTTTAVVIPSGIDQESRNETDYYVIQLVGRETIQRVSGPDEFILRCPRSIPYRLDPMDEVLRYDGSQGKVDVRNLTIVLLVDYAAAEVRRDALRYGCDPPPLIRFYNGSARFSTRLRADMDIELTIEPTGGLLVYNDQYIASMGQKVHVNLTRPEDSSQAKYHVYGDFEIINLGAWSKSNLSVPRTARLDR